MTDKKLKMLAVASSGGHWVQLLRLRPAWKGVDIAYLTTEPGYRGPLQRDAEEAGDPIPRFYSVISAHRWQKFRLLVQLAKIVFVLLRERPDVVLTTGSSPGFFSIQLGKWMGARTIWIDSIANADEMSFSGRNAKRCADLWLTQWPHLARAEKSDDNKPMCIGAVL